MTILSVAAPGNGSGKTLAVQRLLAAFPRRMHAIKFTTVYRDGANCPRKEGACACRELRGSFTIVDRRETLDAPDTDTARMAAAGALSVHWCLARPGAHAEAWADLRARYLTDGEPLLTEGNSILDVIAPDWLLMVMSPAVPRDRWKRGTWELAQRAHRVILNTHGCEAQAIRELAAEVSACREGDTPLVADLSQPLFLWGGSVLHDEIARVLAAPRRPMVE